MKILCGIKHICVLKADCDPSNPRVKKPRKCSASHRHRTPSPGAAGKHPLLPPSLQSGARPSCLPGEPASQPSTLSPDPVPGSAPRLRRSHLVLNEPVAGSRAAAQARLGVPKPTGSGALGTDLGTDSGGSRAGRIPDVPCDICPSYPASKMILVL